MKYDRSGAGFGDAALVVLAGRTQQLGPGRDLRALAQHRAALALGQTAPHTPLDAVVEGLGEAFGAYRARRADLLGLVLLGTSYEQRVRLVRVAGPLRRPVFNLHVCPQ